MVMTGPHCLGIPTKYGQIHFPSQDSHIDPMLLIEDLLFQSFQGFQEDFFKFHNPIVEWLERSYLASSIANNMFQPFLMLAKQDDIEEGAFIRILQGLSDYSFLQKGKNANWLAVMVVTHISSHGQDPLFIVQVIQALIFSLTHYFVSVLIYCIFLL